MIDYDKLENDLQSINNKIEALAVAYPPTIVDLQYLEKADGIEFVVKVTDLPGGVEEISSYDADEVVDFLSEIIGRF